MLLGQLWLETGYTYEHNLRCFGQGDKIWWHSALDTLWCFNSIFWCNFQFRAEQLWAMNWNNFWLCSWHNCDLGLALIWDVQTCSDRYSGVPILVWLDFWHSLNIRLRLHGRFWTLAVDSDLCLIQQTASSANRMAGLGPKLAVEKLFCKFKKFSGSKFVLGIVYDFTVFLSTISTWFWVIALGPLSTCAKHFVGKRLEKAFTIDLLALLATTC